MPPSTPFSSYPPNRTVVVTRFFFLLRSFFFCPSLLRRRHPFLLILLRERFYIPPPFLRDIFLLHEWNAGEPVPMLAGEWGLRAVGFFCGGPFLVLVPFLLCGSVLTLSPALERVAPKFNKVMFLSFLPPPAVHLNQVFRFAHGS